MLYRLAQINDEERFVEIFKKGIHNNELRKMLLLHKPAINTIESLKEAVQGIQTGLLKYARTLTNPPALATAGLGSLQREEFDHRKKTIKQIQELQRRLAPFATASTSNPVPMELDAILRAREEGKEEYSEDSAEEEAEALFFMEPDHDEVRTNKDPEAHDYWEAGLTTDTISALKTGNVDHSQKSCHHCGHKGHIKANCPEGGN